MVFCFAEHGLLSMPQPQRLHPKALHAADQELASALHEQLDRMQDCLIAEQRKAIQLQQQLHFTGRSTASDQTPDPVLRQQFQRLITDVDKLNKELASEAAARRRAEERQERTERQLEQLQSMQQHSMMQRSVEQHGTLQHSMQQQTPDNKMSGVETEPAESQFQASSKSPNTPAENNWRHTMVSPFSDPKPLNEDRGLAKFWDADGALVKTQEAAAPASSADGQAASPKIPTLEMSTWSDDWAFIENGGSRGPITKAKLAFLLHKGILFPNTQVHHVTQHSSTHRPLHELVREWQADSLWYDGHKQLWPKKWARKQHSRRAAWERYRLLPNGNGQQENQSML